MGGPTTDARFVPALKIPVASARSSAGNHSATALVHAGKLAASVKPSTTRQPPNCAAPVTVACSADTIDHAVAATASPRLVPKRSISLPSTKNPIA